MKKYIRFSLIIIVIASIKFGYSYGVSNKPQLQWRRLFNIGLNVGNRAPDFELPLIDGTILTLSSLQGKIVYLDFWASWCSSCRNKKEIIKVYKKYKNEKFKNAEGFTILSVSLDNNKEAWLNAIEKDDLIWTNHVSDLKGWKSHVARKYRIERIPRAYLIDGDGIILDDKISQETIREKLEELKLIE